MLAKDLHGTINQTALLWLCMIMVYYRSLSFKSSFLFPVNLDGYLGRSTVFGVAESSVSLTSLGPPSSHSPSAAPSSRSPGEPRNVAHLKISPSIFCHILLHSKFCSRICFSRGSVRLRCLLGVCLRLWLS